MTLNNLNNIKLGLSDIILSKIYFFDNINSYNFIIEQNIIDEIKINNFENISIGYLISVIKKLDRLLNCKEQFKIDVNKEYDIVIDYGNGKKVFK